MRRSTAVLLLLWLATFALYLEVRPDPSAPRAVSGGALTRDELDVLHEIVEERTATSLAPPGGTQTSTTRPAATTTAPTAPVTTAGAPPTTVAPTTTSVATPPTTTDASTTTAAPATTTTGAP